MTMKDDTTSKASTKRDLESSDELATAAETALGADLSQSPSNEQGDPANATTMNPTSSKGDKDTPKVCCGAAGLDEKNSDSPAESSKSITTTTTETESETESPAMDTEMKEEHNKRPNDENEVGSESQSVIQADLSESPSQNSERFGPRRRYLTRSVLSHLQSPAPTTTTTSRTTKSQQASTPLARTQTSFLLTTPSMPPSLQRVGQNAPRTRARAKLASPSGNGPATPSSLPSSQKKKGTNYQITFPFNLAKFLQAATVSHPELVYWNEDGSVFFIIVKTSQNVKLVGQLVAPFFNHSNYEALRRQLNMYHFTRLSEEGPDKGGWYHPGFQRDSLSHATLSTLTPRKGIRGTPSPAAFKMPSGISVKVVVNNEKVATLTAEMPVSTRTTRASSIASSSLLATGRTSDSTGHHMAAPPQGKGRGSKKSDTLTEVAVAAKRKPTMTRTTPLTKDDKVVRVHARTKRRKVEKEPRSRAFAKRATSSSTKSKKQKATAQSSPPSSTECHDKEFELDAEEQNMDEGDLVPPFFLEEADSNAFIASWRRSQIYRGSLQQHRLLAFSPLRRSSPNISPHHSPHQSYPSPFAMDKENQGEAVARSVTAHPGAPPGRRDCSQPTPNDLCLSPGPCQVTPEEDQQLNELIAECFSSLASHGNSAEDCTMQPQSLDQIETACHSPNGGNGARDDPFSFTPLAGTVHPVCHPPEFDPITPRHENEGCPIWKL